MNFALAVVRSVEGDEAVVEMAKAGCGRCDEPGGCGGGEKADLACRGPRLYRVDNRLGAQVGESVKVIVPDGVIAWSASVAYTVPLLTFFIGAFAGRVLLGPMLGDLSSVIGAMLGLAAGWACLRASRSRPGRVTRPQIVAKS